MELGVLINVGAVVNAGLIVKTVIHIRPFKLRETFGSEGIEVLIDNTANRDKSSYEVNNTVFMDKTTSRAEDSKQSYEIHTFLDSA